MIHSQRYFAPNGKGSFRFPCTEKEGGTHFSADIDFEFVLALAALGRVRMLSSQVELTFVDSCPLKELKLPDNCVLEFASAQRLNELPQGDVQGRITFKFLPKGDA